MTGWDVVCELAITMITMMLQGRGVGAVIRAVSTCVACRLLQRIDLHNITVHSHAVHPFETEDEVVSYVNIVKYGLAGSIWTKDLTTAHRVCRRIDSGILWVNCWLHRCVPTTHKSGG